MRALLRVAQRRRDRPRRYPDLARTAGVVDGGYGAEAPDLLLSLHGIGDITVSGEGFLPLAGLYASGLVEIKKRVYGAATGTGSDTFKLALSEAGVRFVQGWTAGDAGLALGTAA